VSVVHKPEGIVFIEKLLHHGACSVHKLLQLEGFVLRSLLCDAHSTHLLFVLGANLVVGRLIELIFGTQIFCLHILID